MTLLVKIVGSLLLVSSPPCYPLLLVSSPFKYHFAYPFWNFLFASSISLCRSLLKFFLLVSVVFSSSVLSSPFPGYFSYICRNFQNAYPFIFASLCYFSPCLFTWLISIRPYFSCYYSPFPYHLVIFLVSLLILVVIFGALLIVVTIFFLYQFWCIWSTVSNSKTLTRGQLKSLKNRNGKITLHMIYQNEVLCFNQN